VPNGVLYEFECPCGHVFTAWRPPDGPKKARCPECGSQAKRVYGNYKFRIEWNNGGWHGDGINAGLGKHFKSTAERDNYAASKGLVKAGSYL